MAIEYFQAYHSYLPSLSKLSDEQFGRVFRACLQYSTDGTIPEHLEFAEDVAFSFIREQIDRDKQKYMKKCEKNRENASLSRVEVRTPANATERYRTLPNALSHSKAQDVHENTGSGRISACINRQNERQNRGCAAAQLIQGFSQLNKYIILLNNAGNR